jgi:uncharacterized protein YlxW (UPF0749 family)
MGSKRHLRDLGKLEAARDEIERLTATVSDLTAEVNGLTAEVNDLTAEVARRGRWLRCAMRWTLVAGKPVDGQTVPVVTSRTDPARIERVLLDPTYEPAQE